MKSIQQSLISMLKEHSARKHLSVVVGMVAIATVLSVVWSLHINGITLASDDPKCGLQEHVHTEACYDWVVLDGAEEIDSTEATEAVELVDGTEAVESTEATELTATEDTTEETVSTEAAGASEEDDSEETSETNATAAAAVSVDTESEADTEEAGSNGAESAGINTENGTESLAEDTEDGTESLAEGTEDGAESLMEDATEDATEDVTEEATESPQPGDTKVVDGVTYVYELVCGLEEHVHTDECYPADTSEDDADSADESGEAEDSSSTVVKSTTSLRSTNNTDSEDEEELVTVASINESGSEEESESEETTMNALTVSAYSSSGNYTDYYIADTVDFSSGLSSNTDYIIYTKIDDKYYIVASDGSLTACTTISTLSEATGSGPYYVTGTGEIAWGSNANDYVDYCWTVSDSYYIYNSSSGYYMAPDDVTSITTSFSSHTGEVTLSGDFTLTYTFNNVCNGSSNWENYIVEMTDGNGVYLDVRADNYGWLSGQADTDTLTFDDGSDDWDAWLAAMKDGQDVTVEIVKNDTTITMTMTANSETFTATATISAFDDDAELTIYLTGEQCTISGVTYEVKDGDGNTTSTGGTSSASVFTTDKKMATLTDDTSTDGAIVAHGSYGLTNSSTSLAWESGTSSLVFYFASVEDNADGYYFAESVTLYNASQDQAGKYIAYTEIDNVYYLVSAEDGSLLQCTDLSAYTDEDTKALMSTDAGAYIWEIDSDGVPVFKFTSNDTVDFDDYWWTLSSSDANDTGSGTYTISNSENGSYLAPAIKSETISLTGSSINSQSSSYSLGGYGVMEFSVTDIANRSSNMGFTLYVYDNNGGYVRLSLSEVRNNGWGAATITPTITCSYTSAYSAGSITIDPTNTANELIITITTSADGLVINYYNTASNETYIYYVKGADFSGGCYAYLYENSGSLSLSAVTANAPSASVETVTGTYTDNNGFSNTSEEAGVTKKTLDGDFDITYNFTNTSSSDTDSNCNYVIEVYNGSDMYIDVRANGAGWTWDTDTGSNGEDLTAMTSTIDDDWLAAMKNGASCTVRVIRTGNNFLFITTMGSYTNMSYVTLSKFEDCEAQVYLMCNYSELSDITYTNNTASDFSGTYARVASGEKTAVLTADASTSYVWGASSTGIYSENFCLIAQLATDSKTTAEIEWVDTQYATAGSAVTGTASITLSNETVTNLASSGSLTQELSFAKVREYTVYFDGTNGGHGPYNSYTAYYYEDNSENASLVTVSNIAATNATVTNIVLTTYADAVGNYFVRLPYALNPSTVTGRYNYYLQGWYDIYSYNTSVNTSVNGGADYYSDYVDSAYVYDTTTGQSYKKYTSDNWQYTEIQITQNSLFYADWVAQSYDSDIDTTSTTSGLISDVADTSSFVTTKVFDYNDILSLYSASVTQTALTASTHSETWTFVERGSNPLLGSTSTGFVFINGTDRAALYSMTGRNDGNGTEQARIVQGIYSAVNSLTNTPYTIDDLFDETKAYDAAAASGIYGMTYVGEGNYLFQYDSDTGYYYFDSAQNAAYYDQNSQRFYLFEGTVKEVGSGTSTSDFLPFNYDSSYTLTSGSTAETAIAKINYWFGMSTDVDFYLPDAVGYTDSDGEYGNQTSTGDDMVFRFMGDDDVWVMLDGELVLDLGGVHAACYGEINFSTGTVTWVDPGTDGTTNGAFVQNAIGTSGNVIYLKDKSDLTETYANMYDSYVHTSSIEAILKAAGVTDTDSYLSSGSHTLTFYYMERGAGQSNAAIYFSISPVYTLKLAKVIESGNSVINYTGSKIEFQVYTSDDFDNSTPIDTVYTDEKGVLTIDKLRPGTTYYLVETSAPDDFPISYKYLTVLVDAAGNATVKVYNSSGDLIETMDCVAGEDTYTGSEDIADIIASESYKVFRLDTEGTGSKDGVRSLYLADTDAGSNEYVLDNLSVFRAKNDTYSSYLIVTMTYANYLEYELPSTGSIGLFPYERAGIILVLVAVLGLLMIALSDFVQRRRMRMNAYKRGYNEEKAGREHRYAGTRDRPKQRNRIYGRDAPASFSDGSQERSRGTGPGTE